MRDEDIVTVPSGENSEELAISTGLSNADDAFILIPDPTDPQSKPTEKPTTTVTTEATETTAATDPTEPGPFKLDVLHGSLMGLSLVLALTVAVMSVLLKRSRKRTARKAAAPAEKTKVLPRSVPRIGKLHRLGDRDSQQDCFAVSPLERIGESGLLAVVADGMGGLADGDKVSQMAVSTMLDGFLSTRMVPEDILLELTERANCQVNQLLGPAGIGKSGSTLVTGLVKDGRFSYLSIGDSRICLYRDDQLIQLNREHIYRNDLVVQAMNGNGSLYGAEVHPKAAGLTSYLGMGKLKYVDIPASPVTLRGGDKIILMTDGVYNALSDEELRAALRDNAEQAAENIGRMIADKAYRHQDNYTAVILGF